MKYELHPDWGLDNFTISVIEVVEAAADKAAAEGETKKVKDYEKAIELIVQMTKFKYDERMVGMTMPINQEKLVKITEILAPALEAVNEAKAAAEQAGDTAKAKHWAEAAAWLEKKPGLWAY